jgi:YVTN family beta-propeller protein
MPRLSGGTQGGSVASGLRGTVIEFHLLGSLEALEDGVPIGLGAPRQRALLTMLLIHRGRTVSADSLIDALWGETPPPSAVKIVQGYVSNLRRTLGGAVLSTAGHGYRLSVEPESTDLDRFERLVAEGRRALERGEAEAAARTLREAIDLWRGPALAEFADEPFAQPEAARLEEMRLAALTQRIDADLMLGDHLRVAGELQALLRDHPLREAFAAQLMLALYRSGRQADALACYHDIRARLVDELGLEPGPALHELQQAILVQDASLAHAPETRSARAVGESGRPRGRALALPLVLLAAAIIVGLVLAARGIGGHRPSALRGSANSVVAIDVRSDRVVTVDGVGARPGAVDLGAGSLWVANRDDQTISQVDPETLRTVRTISLDDPPNSIVTAGGRIWVAGSGAAEPYVAVDAIDPQFDSIDSTIRIPSVAAGSTGSLATRGSSLWVVASSGELTRIDARTGRVERRIDPDSGPTAIALGADGAVWMIDFEANEVIETDPAGTITTIPVGHEPTSIAVGGGGVWVTDAGDDTVVRIDPTTRAVTSTIEVGEAPLGIALGKGSVWVANSGSGTVSRIDPNSGRVVATIHVGGSPQDIAVDGRRVWVTLDARAAPGGASADRGGTIRLVAGYDVSSMDPALAYDGISYALLDASCAKLLTYPDRSGAAGTELVPEVARSLPVVSDGGRTYTFTIRRGFRFSPPSNAPVTAETFKDTIDRLLDPRMHSSSAADYLDIVGARSFHSGRTARLAGVVAHGNRLIIHLVAPAPDLPARMAEPPVCAVPTDTPISAEGVRMIPSAGPYRIASYAPGQGIVLTRNPNYRGDRPHRPSRIVVQVNIPAGRAIDEVEHGTADDAFGDDFTPAQTAMLARRYGSGSAAARAGDRRYIASPTSQALDFFALNTHRALFSHRRLRQAVNEAIDRQALARLGDAYEPVPEHPTSDYLPPGVPGYRNVHVYPDRPDVARARVLARGFAGSTVTLATCDLYPCADQARIVTHDLAAIGLRVHVRAFPTDTLNAMQESPHARFDMTWQGWIPDFPDPGAMLNVLLESNTVVPSFLAPQWRARLAAAARLSGARRGLAYARLDLELARDAAPLVAFGNPSDHEFFSARVGCKTFNANGLDLAALCVRR